LGEGEETRQAVAKEALGPSNRKSQQKRAKERGKREGGEWAREGSGVIGSDRAPVSDNPNTYERTRDGIVKTRVLVRIPRKKMT